MVAARSLWSVPLLAVQTMSSPEFLPPSPLSRHPASIAAEHDHWRRRGIMLFGSLSPGCHTEFDLDTWPTASRRSFITRFHVTAASEKRHFMLCCMAVDAAVQEHS
ncbi:hypothetical protein LY78DRAFT_186494 [Colletotrichum sublineola]|nr:hypothetical protein LY78DRAFT_186494 [Colletotrichum sublineola]